MRLRSPTTIFLHRARLIFMLTALIPTVFMTAVGIVLLASGGSKSFAVVGGILVLALCATALIGYTVGSIFVARGANLASIQNEFLSSVSHELRTPLTSIRVFIDTLREDRVRDPKDRERCLAVVNQELVRLDGLVGKLIELSKIESRHDAFERQPVAVGDIVDDALAAFAAVKLSGDVDIKVKLDRGLLVHGDRAALAQAVGNLLGNAWKYGRASGKTIEISAEGDAKNVSIAVTDNGVGLPREEQATIFEKFKRGSAAIESGSPGSGLGLAIVRAVAESHNGKVDVHSEMGRGSRFQIILPRHRGQAT